MNVRRVYLDQRDWVRLARQHYGRTNDDAVAGVLALVLEASRTGQASFPLSAVHYLETYHRREPASRQRLGAFMAEVSRFHTIASATDILESEIRLSVRVFGGLDPGPGPAVFGRGVAHAFGEPAPPYFRDPVARRRAIAALGEERLFEHFETALLAGPSEQLPSGGVALPTRDYASRQLMFEKDTARRLREWGHSRDRAHRLVLAQEAQDVVEPVNEQAPPMGVDPRALLADQEAITAFMLSLPAKGTICRLRMTGHEDPNFRWHIGDLNDMVALGTAAGYCDVVVAENHWGDILRRHSEHLRARVTSDLLDLPRLLVD